MFGISGEDVTIIAICFTNIGALIYNTGAVNARLKRLEQAAWSNNGVTAKVGVNQQAISAILTRCEERGKQIQLLHEDLMRKDTV